MAIQPLTRPKMTVAEFLALPEDDSSPVKYELEFGELVEVTRPLWDHNEFIQELASYLRAYLRPRRLGRVSGDVLVVLDEVAGVVLAPDIVVLLAEHLDRLREGRVTDRPIWSWKCCHRRRRCGTWASKSAFITPTACLGIG
jgi:Uncharacterized protein conserved in cyanobacteria